MKNKEIFMLASKNVFNKKKETILTVLIISFLFLIIFLSLTFNNTINTFINNFYYESYTGREYMLYAEYDKVDIEVLKNKLEGINNITQVISSSERMTYTGVDVNDEELGEGIITLFGSNNKVLPKIVKGRGFSNKESNEIQLICPTKMSLNGADDLLYEEYIDVGINKELELKITEYDDKLQNHEIVKVHNYNARVVGLYDAQANMLPSDYCLASFDFVKEINSINITSAREGLIVIIDNYKYYDDINNEIMTLLESEFGIKASLGEMWQIDTDSVELTQSITIMILLISITISVFAEILIISKKVKKRANEIGIYKSIGYDNKTISKLYCVENIMILFLSSLVSFILIILLSQIVIYLANTKYYSLLNFSFDLPLLHFLLAFIIVLISVIVISLISFKFINSKNASQLLGE